MSIREATEEMCHCSALRSLGSLRKENKHQNDKNDEKMLNWLKEKTLTDV